MPDIMEDALMPTPLDLQELHRHWGWWLALGLILICLGTLALGWSVLVTLVSVIFFGWILLIAGVMEAIQAFRQRRWSGFFLHLLNGILAVVVGLLLLINPGAGALVLTLLLAMFFIVAGIFRIVAALHLRFPTWGWHLVSGCVTLILGILIWAQWPVSGLWVIGLFVGIDLIFSGWSRIMLALAARNLPPAAG